MKNRKRTSLVKTERSVYSIKDEDVLKHDTENKKELCEICSDPLDVSVEGDRAIKCRTCGLKVHQACFFLDGSGKTFQCDICKAGLTTIPVCELCPIRSLRAMKPNKKDRIKWSHISCITFMPGVFMNNDNNTYTNEANPMSFKRYCTYCKTKKGGVVFCNNRNCRCCFHVLCGRLHECVFGWDEEKDKSNVLCDIHGQSTYMSTCCEQCQRSDDEDCILLCDSCDRGFHTFCLTPKILKIPDGEWHCPECVQKRITKGEMVLKSTRSSQLVVNLDSTYIAALAEKRSKYAILEEEEEEEEESSEEGDEGVGFYETKRVCIDTKVKDDDDDITSGRSMDCNEVIQALLHFPPKHIERGKVQRFYLMNQFNQWKSLTLSGFNLLLTGLGSKYHVLRLLQETTLNGENCMVINGFNPSFVLTDFLGILYEELFILNHDGMKQDQLMAEVLHRISLMTTHLFIVIHSIDGPGLRSSRIIDYLSQLASYPYCHVIASIDHIRGNLLFSSRALTNFQFIQEDSTTFEPYLYEKMYMTQVSSSFGGKSSSGVTYVLSSLTQNHLKILQLLSKETNGVKKGVSFSIFYEMCLCEMLVSSEKSLQLIMKELEDHELIKRVSDSKNPQEQFVCIVAAKVLTSFCDSLSFVC